MKMFIKNLRNHFKNEIMKEKIFRAYDIRGVFGKDFTAKDIEKIGKGFGTFLGKNKKVVVGRDGRLSSKEIRDSFISGIISTGCNVIDIGLVPTPILYFATIHLKADAGVMITASHNPPEWNGLKFVRGDGQFIFGEEMEKIKDIVLNEEFEETKEKGKVELYENIFNDYSEFVLSKVKIKRKLKIVLDTSNSVCSLFAPKILEKAGCEVKVINEKLDGRFPAHLPEPTKENLKELSKKVLEENADLGAGFDGDGDRVVFVDEKGRIISDGNPIIILFSDQILKKQKNVKIVFDICCSDIVKEFIEKNGGIPIITRVGHVFIKDKLMKEKAVFGGEYSNHFYFSETFYFDDAIFACLKMAEILSDNKKFSEMIDSIPKYFTKYNWNFECPDEKKFKVIEKLKKRLEEKNLNILDLDGVKAIFKDGWIVWRASNTQPQIKVYVEAKTKERFDELCKIAENELLNVWGE